MDRHSEALSLSHTHKQAQALLLYCGFGAGSAGQQAEELLVIHRMSQAAGMPGI